MRTVRIAAVFMMGLLLLTPAACGGGGGGGATPTPTATEAFAGRSIWVS
jgi:hypothetical protein